MFPINWVWRKTAETSSLEWFELLVNIISFAYAWGEMCDRDVFLEHAIADLLGKNSLLGSLTKPNQLNVLHDYLRWRRLFFLGSEYTVGLTNHRFSNNSNRIEIWAFFELRDMANQGIQINRTLEQLDGKFLRISAPLGRRESIYYCTWAPWLRGSDWGFSGVVTGASKAETCPLAWV